MTKVRPLISYYGGKQRIASKIVPYLQAIPHTVRAIPFAGGLGVFYSWPRPTVSNDHHYREAINDKSELLINLYRVARKYPDEFERLINLTPYSQAEHRESWAICKNPEGYSDLEKAWAYFININCSFSNRLNSGWKASVFGHNEAATWQLKTQNLPQALQRLTGVYIACEDALDFIERWDSPQTLFYLDPPYPKANQGHYKGYSLDDWADLCALLDEIEGSYVLSNYPQEIEPKADRKVEINAVMSASGQGTAGRNRNKTRAATKEELGDRARTEVLWIRDRSANIRKELEPALRQVMGNNYGDPLASLPLFESISNAEIK